MKEKIFPFSNEKAEAQKIGLRSHEETKTQAWIFKTSSLFNKLYFTAFNRTISQKENSPQLLLPICF